MLLLALKEGGSWKSMGSTIKVQISGQDLCGVLRRPPAVVPGLFKQRNRQFCLVIVLTGGVLFSFRKVLAQFIFLVVQCVIGGAMEGRRVVLVAVGLLVNVLDLGLQVFEVLVDGGLGFRGAELVVFVEDVKVGASEDVVWVTLLLYKPLYPLYLSENAADEYLKLLLQVRVDSLQLLVFLSGRRQLRLVSALALEHALDLPLQEAVVVLQVFVLAEHRQLYLPEIVLVASHSRKRGTYVTPAFLVGRRASKLESPRSPPHCAYASRLTLVRLSAAIELQMRRAGSVARGQLFLPSLRLQQHLLLYVGIHAI